MATTLISDGQTLVNLIYIQKGYDPFTSRHLLVSPTMGFLCFHLFYGLQTMRRFLIMCGNIGV